MSTSSSTPQPGDPSAAAVRQAPAGIDPNAACVEFVRHECRSCGQSSDPFDKHGPVVPAASWDARHRETTGHKRFYLWTITRQTSEPLTVRR